MDFSIKIKLPSGKTIRIPELKNKDYFTILKFCENEDIEGLNEFFHSFLFENLPTIDIIDKFYILVLVRMMYVDPELVLVDSNNININFGLQNIINNIDLLGADYTKAYQNNKFSLELGLPTSLYFTNIEDLYLSVIKQIKIADKVVNFSNITKEEREEILTYIPSSVFNIIKTHIDGISDNLSNFVVIEGSEDCNIEEFNLNIISNGVITFLLSIFSTGLTVFFEMLYVFTSKLGFTAEDFYNLTPLDSKVILNIYKKEISEKEEELKNQEGV